MQEKEALERKKMGMTGTLSAGGNTSGVSGGSKVSMRGAQKTVLTVKKLQDAPTRLLKEVDIIAI